ncbi:MAG: HEPN domain-containing protein [Candidatus Bathyarchaeia archaeon]
MAITLGTTLSPLLLTAAATAPTSATSKGRSTSVSYIRDKALNSFPLKKGENAEDFLGAAIDLFKTGRWAQSLLHCHQCIELALKAGLNALGLERRGHGLNELLEELIQYRRGFERFRGKIKVLDQYYIPTRYANAFYSGSAAEHYTKKQAEEALKYAEEIFQGLKNLVAERKAP